MPRPCLICSSKARLKKAAELIAAGCPDQAIANALNRLGHRTRARGAAEQTPRPTTSLPMSYMAVSRHRRLHVLKVAQDQIALVGKGRAARLHRERLAAAGASDAPTPAQFVEAFFGLRAQAEKLTRIEDRLERVAVLAEESASPNAVAQVAAQQLRSVEVGAKVAGVGGYAPARAADQPAAGAKFSVTIQFSNGTVERITPIDEPARPPTIDAGGDPYLELDEG
jgi:hypothetical protein